MDSAHPFSIQASELLPPASPLGRAVLLGTPKREEPGNSSIYRVTATPLVPHRGCERAGGLRDRAAVGAWQGAGQPTRTGSGGRLLVAGGVPTVKGRGG